MIQTKSLPYLTMLILSPALAASLLSAQEPLPQPEQPRVVDGSSGSSLIAAYKDACKSGGTVIVTSGYPGKEPLPVEACDHHLAVLDLRQGDSLTGRLNVKRFGAAGDGKTDDTAAVRAAIAYSLSHLADQAAPLIYFPAGTFLIKGELRITSQSTIAGDGEAVSTIKQIDPQSNLFTVTRAHTCSTGQCFGGMSNLTLAGNGHLTRGTLLEIDGTEEYRLDHLALYNTGGRGLQMNGDSERLDSHDLSVSFVRWPIVIAEDSNESYFYTTKVMFPGLTADNWCYNISCIDGRYPTQGPVPPDPHAAITVYTAEDVGFYGGSIKPLQMIGGFKVFNTGVTTLDHFYLEYGYVNPGVIAGGVSDWTTTTASLSATALSVPVRLTDWMPQFYTTASDVPLRPSSIKYVILPPDFAWNSQQPSSLGAGIARGTYEIVGIAAFAGDGAFHIASKSRGLGNSKAHDWPLGAIVEAYNTGIFGLRISNSHINEQDSFKEMGPSGAGLTQDCDNTGVKTCAEIILGYIPDGRWVQPHGSPGDMDTEAGVTVALDNDKMFYGGPNVGVIAVHSRGFLSMTGIGGGPSDGETAEVPYTLDIAKVTGGKAVVVPTYSNGKHPSFYLFDGNNGRVMASDSGFFTQFASVYDQGKYLSGRQYANNFSIFDIPPMGKHPLNSVTFLGGPDTAHGEGLRYDHWTGHSWSSLFSVTATPNDTANVNVNGIMTARGLKIGDGPVITSLNASGTPAAVAATLTGITRPIGGSALAAGQCATGDAAVNGATTKMAVTVSPAFSPGDGYIWQAFVSRANLITVKVCALAAGTPQSAAYAVRVLP